MLKDALGGPIGAPLIKIQTVEQVRAARGDDRSSTAPEAELPVEVHTQLVHALLDKQYRALLDELIEILSEVSPQAASRSVKGRERIAAWLKHLENRFCHAMDHGGLMATYDVTRLWRELKVEHLRK
jgi:hypothetical protein